MSLEGLAQLVAAGAGSLILVGLATPFTAAIGGVAVLCIAAPIESRVPYAHPMRHDAHNGACRLERRPDASIFQPNRLSVSGMSAQKARISA
jgi:hypothetical protein